jgi:hypothetical protein
MDWALFVLRETGIMGIRDGEKAMREESHRRAAKACRRLPL